MADHPTTAAATTKPLKFITGADSFGCSLKNTLVSHLRSLNIEVEDIGEGPYYSIGEQIGKKVAAEGASTTRGLVACGTGVGVQIFANKIPGVYAATCLTSDEAKNTRAINNANVLAVSGMSTSPETAVEILDTFINTPFKSPCPASGNKEWDPKIGDFLSKSLPEMAKIGTPTSDNCTICSLAKNREFEAVDIIPGAKMKIVRENPTSAVIRFEAGSVEPAHHHSFGHDLFVIKGKKIVWNLSKEEKYELSVGDYLFTPAGDVHRVKYLEDSEFFLKWDGPWDIVLDEDLESAKAAIAKDDN